MASDRDRLQNMAEVAGLDADEAQAIVARAAEAPPDVHPLNGARHQRNDVRAIDAHEPSSAGPEDYGDAARIDFTLPPLTIGDWLSRDLPTPDFIMGDW